MQNKIKTIFHSSLFRIILMLLLPLFVRAQLNAPVPPVTLQMEQVEWSELFRELERQTGLFFSYESGLLEGLPKISLSAEEESFSYLLKRLFQPFPVTWRITGNYIILKRKPRQFTISGLVRDSISYESLISASVYDRNSGKGGTSNSYGFYSITLPEGEVVLQVSYVGYESRTVHFELVRDTLLDFPLLQSGLLQEIVVKGKDPFSDIYTSRMGGMELSAADIRQMPVVFSEPDPLKNLQQLPGVAPGTEGLTGMYVRGGGGDENLFLLDGVPIYNVSHIGGIFSTFNSDVIKHVDFYKGGFPARYGGRLSSVVDVRMKEGNRQKIHGSISFGLLSAKAHLEGPLVKDKTSFNLAFRRTWLDAITSPAMAIASRRNNYDVFAGYSYYDLNGKISHIFSSRSRMDLNFYMGQDRLRYKDWVQDNISPIGEDLKWRWGNLLSSVNWNYLLSQKLVVNFNAAYTRYRSRMQSESIRSPFYWSMDSFRKSSFTEQLSGIEDFYLKADFDYMPLPEHRVRFGMDYTLHRYHPEEKMRWVSYVDSISTSVKEQQYVDQRVKGNEWGIYVEDDWLMAERWKINIGARLAAYQVEKSSYFSFQPRISLRYLIREDLSAKVSYVKMNQYNHQLSNTYANLPSDIWVPVTAKVAPMHSHQVAAGLYYRFRDLLDFSMEGYYKKMNNLIEYQDYAYLFPRYINWDKRVSSGKGRSYGGEWMVAKKEGKTSGWASYTLSWSDRQFPDGTVNEGKRFPSKFDNRHKINITLIHKLTEKMDISASWNYMTGNRMTIPRENYLAPNPDGNFEPNNNSDYITIGGFDYEPIYARNAVRLGDYHRLDLSLNIYRPKKKGRMGIWNISLYNAYCRVNPMRIDYVSEPEPGRLKIGQSGFIPIIPSFSYTYKF